MGKIRLEKINEHLNEELKNEKFKSAYEFERAKVSLAQKIALMREEENLRQVDLAKKLGVSQQFVSQIETAQEKNITINTLLRIAVSLNRRLTISFPKISAKRNSQLKIA
jgi:DNA-binding XRE family transcriptional regulator